MKGILLVSVVLNLALGGTAIYLVKSGSVSSAPPVVVKPAVPDRSVVEKRKAGIKKLIPPAAGELRKEFNWQSMEAEDYKEYIANLRAIGCPQETIQDIIAADINQLYAEKARAQWKDEFKFWDTKQPYAFMGGDNLERNLELQEEKRAVLRDLLGTDIVEKPDMFGGGMGNSMEMMFSFLPKEKQVKMMELQMDMMAKYADKQADLSSDPEAVKKLMKESNDALAGILSPEEFREYELRLSGTAQMMRMELGAFEPNKEEFMKLFDLRKKYDEEHGTMFGNLGGQLDETQAKAKAQLDEQIKSTLGENRFKEYERSSDPTYRGMVKLTERQGLPREAANQLFDVKKTYEDGQRKLLTDSNLQPERRQQALVDLRNETEREVTQLLGDKYDAFKKNTQISVWLQNPVVAPQAQ